ncbi:MAG: hypothetical protein JO057_04720 [Chloroflexi bacterium]|nr:hypothetical protein [Chloroflexota bacterium]
MQLDNLDLTTPHEVDAELVRLLANRQALYDLSSELIMLDYRPEFAKLHRRGSRSLGHGLKGASLLDSLGHLFVYIHLAWETGILNTLHSCRRQGVTREQLLDVFMAGQLTGGPRGAENIYRAVWMMLRDYQDRPEPAEFPDGWSADDEAFRCGLDLSTPELTPGDYRALTEWYERTLGEVPESVMFAARYHPRFLKNYRAKWEGAFRGGLPKQMMPYMTLRYCTVSGFRAGIRENALLARAWGVRREYVVHAVASAAYYQNGLPVVSIASEALRDILESWE